MKKAILLIVLVVSSLVALQAQVNKVPATKKPIEYKQPDGSTVTIFMKGDEKLHWAETADGYTLLSNTEGGYEYAKLDKKKNLVKSGKLAHDKDKRTKKEARFLKKVSKGLQFSNVQIEESKEKFKPKQ